MTSGVAPDSLVWQRLSDNAGTILAAPAWQQHLARSLRSNVHFVADDDGGDGIVVQVFRRGPFRAGYIGFPIGGTVLGAPVGSTRVERLLKSPLGRKLHILRVTESAFGPPEDVPGELQHVPETCVAELANCQPEQIAKVRHDLARARRAGVRLSSAIDLTTADRIWETYATTIARHGGAARYGRGYFNGLVSHAMADPRLRILTASIDGNYAGYLVIALHGAVAYYLHAGVQPDYQKTGAGDLLLAEAIGIAKETGMRSFNLMASPASQPGLIRFKEKWGGVTKDQTVRTIDASRSMAMLLRLAEKSNRLWNRLGKRTR